MVHCPCLIISFTMVSLPKYTVFFQTCTNSVVLICIFSKSCTTKEKSCTFLVHCHWLLISLTMLFVQKCTVFSKAVQILWSSYVYFLKSCTTIKKLYNQREKLYIFSTLSWALNFIDNGVGRKMYSFFQSCPNSVVLICIFLKSCTTEEKSCTSLVHYPWLLISLTMVFVRKCTVFSKAVQILWSSYVYF